MDVERKVLIMPRMSLRQYAAYRKTKGLPGGTPAAVSKAVNKQRIQRDPDGLIDSDRADAAWKLNTLDRGQFEEGANLARPTTPGQGELRIGRCSAAQQLCSTVRRIWPIAVVTDYFPDLGMRGQVTAIALFCKSVEAWLAGYVALEQLPAVDWKLFSAESPAAQREYEGNSKLPFTPGPVDGLVGLPELVPGLSQVEQGRRWLAYRVCLAARLEWPRLVSGIFEADSAASMEHLTCTVHLCALLLTHLEGWLGDAVASSDLPAINWTAIFASRAAVAEEQYQTFRKEWGA